MYFSARPKLNHPAHKKRKLVKHKKAKEKTGHNEYTYFNKAFIENINKLKLYKNSYSLLTTAVIK